MRFAKILLTALVASMAFNVAAKVSAKKPASLPNPLLAPWTGPYGGVPPFDKVQVSLFKEALEEGMNQGRLEIEAIANNPLPADFENTIAAMERSGESLMRVANIFYVWSGSLSTPEVKTVETEMAPLLAAYDDEIMMNGNPLRVSTPCISQKSFRSWDPSRKDS